MSMEQIVRPFVGDFATGVTVRPGTTAVPPVRVSVGLVGGTKFFTTAGNSSRSTRIGHVHQETSPYSSVLQNKLAQTQ